MAARKKKTGARTRASARKGAFDIQLPATLHEFRRDIAKQLARLEREIEKTAVSARKEATRLLREASHTLGRYEQLGEKAWKSLTRNTRRDAENLARRLERFLTGGRSRAAGGQSAKPGSAKATTGKKRVAGKAAGKKKVAQRKSTKKKAATARAATKTTKKKTTKKKTTKKKTTKKKAAKKKAAKKNAPKKKAAAKKSAKKSKKQTAKKKSSKRR